MLIPEGMGQHENHSTRYGIPPFYSKMPLRPLKQHRLFIAIACITTTTWEDPIAENTTRELQGHRNVNTD